MLVSRKKKWKNIHLIWQFNSKARDVFGSGWVWLFEYAGHLHVLQFRNHDAPIGLGPAITPLFGLDLWEHAYYLDYQDDREVSFYFYVFSPLI